MGKINRQNLSSQVYSILKEMIVNHRFRPGVRLNVEQLTKQIGVSRTPVWEAVQRLIQEGLLKSIPNRGVFMSELTPEMAIELYTVRGILEGLAARLAVQNIDDKTLERMAKSLEDQRRVIEKNDLIGYSRLSFDFHWIVIESSGNQILKELLELIRNKMRPITMHIEPILLQLYKEHLEILEALKARDPDKAELIFKKHNRHMIEQIKKSVENDSWKEVDEVNMTPQKGKKMLSVSKIF
jgi:DNA-binding GntR family transcriptional regulator